MATNNTQQEHICSLCGNIGISNREFDSDIDPPFAKMEDNDMWICDKCTENDVLSNAANKFIENGNFLGIIYTITKKEEERPW